MAVEQQADFAARAAALPDVEVINFDAHLENLMDRAIGVVAMGGYNTFCEILSFDKPAVLIPRERPRLEQFIRVSQAQALGLVDMLPMPDEDATADVANMLDALRRLPRQNRPSAVELPHLLGGLENIERLASELIDEPPAIPAIAGL